MSVPYHMIEIDSSYGGQTTYDQVTFNNFKTDKTWCGQSQKLIALNPLASDYIPRVKLTRPHFNNVHQDAIAYIMSPDKVWANTDDCGNFPCSAPLNTLVQFEGATYSGSIKPSETARSFQIVGNNS